MTLAHVNAYGYANLDAALPTVLWLAARYPVRVVQWGSGRPWDSRQRACEQAIRDGFKSLVLCDPDVIVDASADLAPWLASTAEAVFCRCHPGKPPPALPEYHLPLVRVSLDFLRDVPKPWFTGPGDVGCDCEAFRRLVVAGGGRCEAAGWVTHKMLGTWRNG